MFQLLVDTLAAGGNQRIGLRLAIGIEHPQITQVSMAGGKVRGEGQLQAIPGARA